MSPKFGLERETMKKLLEILFGCRHKHCGFPITARQGKQSRTYRVCLDCGREIPYNWETLGAVKAA